MPDTRFCANLDGGNEGYCRKYKTKKAETFNDKILYCSKVLKKCIPWSQVPKLVVPIDDSIDLKNFMDNFCHQNSSACGGEAGTWKNLGEELIGKIAPKKKPSGTSGEAQKKSLPNTPPKQ